MCRAVQLEETENAPTVEGPQLWGLQEVAVPLGDRLRLHFAGGLPTDRVDRPEWLFATALKLVKAYSAGLGPLQPAIEAHALQHLYYVPFEFARAIRTAVQVPSAALDCISLQCARVIRTAVQVPSIALDCISSECARAMHTAVQVPSAALALHSLLSSHAPSVQLSRFSLRSLCQSEQFLH